MGAVGDHGIYTKKNIADVIAALAVDIPAYGPDYATALLKFALAFGVNPATLDALLPAALPRDTQPPHPVSVPLTSRYSYILGRPLE